MTAYTMSLLFVCASEATVQAALQSASELDWNTIQASYDTYISSRRRPHFPESLKSCDCCVAFIDFDQDPEQAASSAAYLNHAFRDNIVLIAVSGRNEPGSMLSAMRAGCTEFLAQPVQTQSLQVAFGRVQQRVLERKTNVRASGSVLALLGAKGGVGTTTLGVHLATYLVQNNGKKVLLIDSKAQFGHVCIYLGMEGSGCHFQEVVSNVSRLDSELLQAFVGRHPSGLDLLSSPEVGQSARALHPDDVQHTLDFLRTEYDFVIVDCDDSADEITRAIIAASSQVYVVATPDITAIRDLSRHVDDLARTDDASKIHIVINRYSSQFAVGLEEVEKAIRLPISYSVPNNYIELVRSANLGVPVSAEGKSGFTTELLKWANALVGAVAQQPSSKPQSATAPNAWKLLKNLASTLSIQTSTAGKRV